jgi:hypothetical protein
MAGASVLAPLSTSQVLQELKYSMLSTGHDLMSFHASQDLIWVRDQVISQICLLKGLKVHVIHAKKALVPNELKSSYHLHSHFAREFIRFSLRAVEVEQADQVVVIFDQALSSSQQGAFHAAIKSEIKKSQKLCRIYFHSMKTDFNGQIADYVAWAKFKQLERSESRPWNFLMKSLQPTEQVLFG